MRRGQIKRKKLQFEYGWGWPYIGHYGRKADYRYPSLNTFEDAKKRYEQVVPLAASKDTPKHSCKRAGMNIRPVGIDRRNSHAQIFKISSEEYAVSMTTYNASWWVHRTEFDALTVEKKREFHRGISWMKDGRIIVRPAVYRGTFGGDSWAVRNLWNQVLPKDVWLEYVGGQTYLAVRGNNYVPKYYIIPEKGLTLTRNGRSWDVKGAFVAPTQQRVPLKLHDAFKRAMDSFTDYADVYWDLVPASEADRKISWCDWLPNISPDNTEKRFELLKAIKDRSWAWSYASGRGGGKYQMRPAKLALPEFRAKLRHRYYKQHKDEMLYTPLPIGKLGSKHKY